MNRNTETRRESSTKENPGFSGFSPTWDLGHCNRDVRSGAVPLEHWAWAHLLYVGVFGDFSVFFLLFLFFFTTL